MKIIQQVIENQSLPAFKIHNKIIKEQQCSNAEKMYRHVSRLKKINPEVLAEFAKEEKYEH